MGEVIALPLLIAPFVVLAVIYLVVRVRQGPPPAAGPNQGNGIETPHEQESIPRDGDGMPVGMGDPAEIYLDDADTRSTTPGGTGSTG